jgi:hypothetical protein
MFTNTLFGQVIKFERTDVENPDATFVTATQSFGIDIRIDSIENCSNVAFELSHNQAMNVKLSAYQKSNDWNIYSDWEKVVTIVKPVYNSQDSSVIAIECGTGMPADSVSPDRPMIIHLDFVVSPSAWHDSILRFNISKVKATYFKDTIVELIIPTVFTIPYQLHSYVNVWPGDANCDGYADAYDWQVISLYLTEPGIDSRSFKRPNASILWQSQRCIAWDILSATYADCDGNGYVTTSDMAVVSLNYGKAPHSDVCNSRKPTDTNSSMVWTPGRIKGHSEQLQHNTFKIPITLNETSTRIVGAAGVIDLSEIPECSIVDIEPGNYFNGNIKFYRYVNENTNKATFCITSDMPAIENNGNTIGYLVVENNEDVKSVDISQYIGFDTNGNVFNLSQATTSIDIYDEEPTFTTMNIAGMLTIRNAADLAIKNITIYNQLGMQLIKTTNTENVDISNLPRGMYVVIGLSDNAIYSDKFIISE